MYILSFLYYIIIIYYSYLVYTYLYIYIYIYTSLFIYTYMYSYIYIYIYNHITAYSGSSSGSSSSAPTSPAGSAPGQLGWGAAGRASRDAVEKFAYFLWFFFPRKLSISFENMIFRLKIWLFLRKLIVTSILLRKYDFFVQKYDLLRKYYFGYQKSVLGVKNDSRS